MTNQIHNAEPASAITEEVKLIPRWSIAAASLAFVFMQYLYWVILPAYRQSLHVRPIAAPLGVRFYFALSWSTLAALYMLMVGYVSRDAPRRSMSTRLWVVICLALPGWHWFGALLFASPACGCALPLVWHQHPHRVPFLPPVCLPGLRGLRQLLQRCPDH